MAKKKSKAVAKIYQPEELEAYVEAHIQYTGVAKWSLAGILISLVVVVALGMLIPEGDDLTIMFSSWAIAVVLAIIANKVRLSRKDQFNRYLAQVAQHPELLDEEAREKSGEVDDETRRMGEEVIEVVRKADHPLLFRELCDRCLFKDETATRVLGYLVKTRQIFEDVDLETGDFVYVLGTKHSKDDNLCLAERMNNR